jgi:hypothetical protein
MNREVRRILEMVLRVLNFWRAHPSADANHASVFGRLEEVYSRMEVLVAQQVGGFLSRRSSVVRRRELRRRLHHGLLRHLVTIAGSAAKEKPELVERFALPSSSVSNKLFRTVARKMLEQGQAEKELLLKHGLGAALLDELGAAIDQFDASVAETSSGVLDHVTARAELEELSDEAMRLVGMLDGINRYRFEKDPQLLVAWKSAKNVVSGPQVEPAAPPVPTPSGEQPPSEEAKPAA